MYYFYEKLTAFSILALCIFVGVYAAGQNKTKKECLSMGYPQHYYSMMGQSYCIKRQDQSDVVIPLGK